MRPRPAPLPAALAETLRDPDLRDPDLRGARCAGCPDLIVGFLDGEDAAARTARHRHAVALCTGCTARAACARIAATLTDRDRDGVWAGQVWASGAPVHSAPADDPSAA